MKPKNVFPCFVSDLNLRHSSITSDQIEPNQIDIFFEVIFKRPKDTPTWNMKSKNFLLTIFIIRFNIRSTLAYKQCMLPFESKSNLIKVIFVDIAYFILNVVDRTKNLEAIVLLLLLRINKLWAVNRIWCNMKFFFTNLGLFLTGTIIQSILNLFFLQSLKKHKLFIQIPRILVSSLFFYLSRKKRSTMLRIKLEQ